jgi:hypothetical protein
MGGNHKRCPWCGQGIETDTTLKKAGKETKEFKMPSWHGESADVLELDPSTLPRRQAPSLVEQQVKVPLARCIISGVAFGACVTAVWWRVNGAELGVMFALSSLFGTTAAWMGMGEVVRGIIKRPPALDLAWTEPARTDGVGRLVVNPLKRETAAQMKYDSLVRFATIVWYRQVMGHKGTGQKAMRGIHLKHGIKVTDRRHADFVETLITANCAVRRDKGWELTHEPAVVTERIKPGDW